MLALCLLVTVTLAGAAPPMVWRGQDGALCAACTFAATVSDDCCPSALAEVSREDCHACCVLTAHEGKPQREPKSAAPIAGLTAPRQAVIPPPLSARAAVLAADDAALPSPPRLSPPLRAPPFPV